MNIVAIVGSIAGLVSIVALLLFLVFQGKAKRSRHATYSFLAFLSGFVVFLVSFGLVADAPIAAPMIVGAVPLLVIACWLRWTSRRKTSAVES